MNEAPEFDKAISFLCKIHISIIEDTLDDEACFLPGFMIKKGVIVMDKNKIKFHGDILHEAAHIAVVPSEERYHLHGKNIGCRKDAAAEEMMAIAWSYAACVHLNIDPHFVFHEHGYKGGGAAIVEEFEKQHYIGVPVLQWLGMTTTDSKKDKSLIYPAMIKWLRD